VRARALERRNASRGLRLAESRAHPTTRLAATAPRAALRSGRGLGAAGAACLASHAVPRFPLRALYPERLTRRCSGAHAGLLPPFQMPQELQIARVMTNVRSLSTNLERYSHLVALQERNERLFYAVLTAYPDELKPIIYAPTVGQACVKYGLLFRRPRGLFISMADRGRVYSLLKNWPEKDVKLLCLTDGERVLGLGDLGIQGMGIAASKVVCYTAFGGIDPSAALPVTIDAGTDNEMLLNDPFYIGLRHKCAIYRLPLCVCVR
jgi:hypothetical protein